MQNNIFTLSSWHTFSQIIAAFQHIFVEVNMLAACFSKAGGEG